VNYSHSWITQAAVLENSALGLQGRRNKDYWLFEMGPTVAGFVEDRSRRAHANCGKGLRSRRGC
jgi:hypothetical protein